MIRITIILHLLVFCIVNISAQESIDTQYLGQDPPGLTPEKFAPGLVSKDGRYEQQLVVSPDGKEICFALTNSNWSYSRVYITRFENGEWSEITKADFLGGFDGWSPHYSADGNTFFFASPGSQYPPTNIYKCNRTETGWSTPEKIASPISSSKDEWGFSLASDETMYLCSHRKEGSLGGCDIYRSECVNGEYQDAQPMNFFNTTRNDCAPCISHDQHYIIFNSDRSGGLGKMDLYISIKNQDGSWSEPKNLGEPINSIHADSNAFITPDGKFLFFTRRTTSDSDIYWVDSNAISSFIQETCIEKYETLD
jgi:Tol biopolymer transport system component